MKENLKKNASKSHGLTRKNSVVELTHIISYRATVWASDLFKMFQQSEYSSGALNSIVEGTEIHILNIQQQLAVFSSRFNDIFLIIAVIEWESQERNRHWNWEELTKKSKKMLLSGKRFLALFSSSTSCRWGERWRWLHFALLIYDLFITERIFTFYVRIKLTSIIVSDW